MLPNLTRNWLLCAVLALLLAPTLVVAFKEGDYISGMRRTRLGTEEMATEWKAFHSSQLPRFKVAREVVWNTLDMEQVNTLNNREFKLQLSFDRGLFQTSWIALYSYNPLLVLRRCDFVFIYSDSTIVDLKVYPEYTTISELQLEGGAIVFSYAWSEFGEHDIDTAYMYLFGFPALLALVFTFKILTGTKTGKTGRDLRA